MTYEEFAREIYRNIKNALKGEYNVKLEELLKCNDCRKKQLIMERKEKKGKITAALSIGLEWFYGQYRSGDSVSEKEELNRMIPDVNETMVAEEEILSDHAYFYCAESGKIEI